MVLEADVVHRPVTLWFGPKIVAYCSPAVARVVVFAEGFVEGRRRGCSLSRLQQLQQLYCCYCAAARRPLLLPLAIRGGRRRNAEKAAAEAAAEEDHYCVFLWQSWRYYALALLLLVLVEEARILFLQLRTKQAVSASMQAMNPVLDPEAGFLSFLL